jgi:BCCT family betaine/carnitine transporter
MINSTIITMTNDIKDPNRYKIIKKLTKIDIPLVVISILAVFGTMFLLILFPEKSSNVAISLFCSSTETLGSFVLITAFLFLAILIYLLFSKYGNIRLGGYKADYSNFSWISMMFMAGLASGTVYWGFIEWAYYYMAPPYGIESGTSLAYEWAQAYNFFHWGFTAWAIYCVAALPIAYNFHVRKNEGLRLSSVFNEATKKVKLPYKNILMKLVDIIFIFTVLGGLSVTLALSVPMIGESIASALSIEHTFVQDMILVLLIALIYSFSSYIGIDKGMKKISSLNAYITIIFTIIVLAVGPSLFIIKLATNSVGLMLQNFLIMSFWTDPINESGFPETWTVFYWLWWVTYAPFVGLFVARISKGRKIKEVILAMLLAGSLGVWTFFGVVGGLSLNDHLVGKLDVVGIINGAGGGAVHAQIINQLPFSGVLIIMFIVMSVLFLATTLDSASFTLATTVRPTLKSGEDPSPFNRLFWCLMITALPLTLMSINAPLNTIKTCAVLTAIPLLLILIILIVGFISWLKEDYGEMHSHEIKELHK